MWCNKNKNKNKKIISLDKFNYANNIVKEEVVKTPLYKLNKISDELYHNNVYLKDESKQLTNSFKMRGVYYVIYKEIQNIKSKYLYDYSIDW